MFFIFYDIGVSVTFVETRLFSFSFSPKKEEESRDEESICDPSLLRATLLEGRGLYWGGKKRGKHDGPPPASARRHDRHLDLAVRSGEGWVRVVVSARRTCYHMISYRKMDLDLTCTNSMWCITPRAHPEGKEIPS